ncbi:hypothetical protein C8R45DRAFT_1007851 [Mycena sanguinolenta]|nr:hypothetical protein C8R45DRAFT_1007851 [Mycena sanguinolenta]
MRPSSPSRVSQYTVAPPRATTELAQRPSRSLHGVAPSRPRLDLHRTASFGSWVPRDEGQTRYQCVEADADADTDVLRTRRMVRIGSGRRGCRSPIRLRAQADLGRHRRVAGAGAPAPSWCSSLLCVGKNEIQVLETLAEDCHSLRPPFSPCSREQSCTRLATVLLPYFRAYL